MTSTVARTKTIFTLVSEDENAKRPQICGSRPEPGALSPRWTGFPALETESRGTNLVFVDENRFDPQKRGRNGETSSETRKSKLSDYKRSHHAKKPRPRHRHE